MSGRQHPGPWTCIKSNLQHGRCCEKQKDDSSPGIQAKKTLFRPLLQLRLVRFHLSRWSGSSSGGGGGDIRSHLPSTMRVYVCASKCAPGRNLIHGTGCRQRCILMALLLHLQGPHSATRTWAEKTMHRFAMHASSVSCMGDAPTDAASRVAMYLYSSIFMQP